MTRAKLGYLPTEIADRLHADPRVTSLILARYGGPVVTERLNRHGRLQPAFTAAAIEYVKVQMAKKKKREKEAKKRCLSL